MIIGQLTIDDVPLSTRRLLEPVRSIWFPQQGATSTVTVIECDHETVVLKYAPGPQFDTWLEREQRVLSALRESALPIPGMLHFERNDNGAWLLMSYLPGVPLSTVLPTMRDRTARVTLIERWGATLAALHCTPVPTALYDPRPWLDRILDQAAYNLQYFPVDGSRALLDSLRRERPSPVPQTLIHGDCSAGNTLVTGDQIVGLIDWAGGAYGDPRYDLALALDDLADQADQAAFWRGYGGRRLSAVEQRYFVGIYEFF